MEGAVLIGLIDAVARETMLFAAIWFLVGGIDDLAIDFAFAIRWAGRRFGRTGAPLALAAPVPPGRIAIFVGAWDESAVIGRMLESALARFDHPDYRLYVGTYPNDPATIAAVSAVAAADARVRLVVGAVPGPTTKADCLNGLWRSLLADEAADGVAVLGVLLHDAEDLVHPLELRLVAEGLARYDSVQLPVLPLPHPRSRFVSGHYCDEFAEAHSKQLLVREMLGAGLPLAGVGCAIRRAMLVRIAESRGGQPFDASSLTEDYELGLTIRAMGGRATLARVPERPGGLPVAVRAYFPDTLDAAVRQKARWMTGIALAGWDRTGWSRAGDFADHWMRMRDRRAILAIPVLVTAYVALLFWTASFAGHAIGGSAAPAPPETIQWLLGTNMVLLLWRLAVRAAFVGAIYGAFEAVLSVPRMVVANVVSLFAAQRAASLYLRMLAGSGPQWDKTAHQFPDPPGQQAA